MHDHLDRLDRAAAAVTAATADALRTLTPIPADVLAEWGAATAAVRSELAARAAGLGVAAPDWRDREGLGVAVADLAERAAAPRRERWARVAAQLGAGRFEHRLPRRSQQLDDLRRRAAAECAAAGGGAGVDPGGPADGADWLSWAWQAPADRFARLVEALADPAPSLAALLEDAHLDWWVPATAPPAAEPEFIPVEPEPPAPVADVPPPSAPPEPEPAEPAPIPVQVIRPEPEPPPDPAEPAPAAVRAVRPLPEELTGLEAFGRRYWIDPTTGLCATAPWADRETFVAALSAALDGAVAAAGEDLAALGPAVVFAAALHGEAATPAVGPATLSAAADVWAEPHRTSVGRDPDRARAIRDGRANSPELRLALVLEAMRPSRDDPPAGPGFAAALLYEPDLSRAVDRAGFGSEHLRECVRGLLTFHTLSESDPLAQLRAALSRKPAKPVDYPGLVKKKREELHAEVRRVSLNAGSAYVGKFKHCKLAWEVFMEFLLPALSRLYPTGPAQWDPAEVAAWARTVLPKYRAIADRHEAREKSRTKMDRVADGLVALVEELNDLMRAWRAGEAAAAEDLSVLRRHAEALAAGRLPVPDEEVGRRLVLAAVSPADAAPAAHPLTVPPGYFAETPELLGLLSGPPAPGDDRAAPRFDELTPARRAAALLLTRGRAGAPAGSWDDAAHRCRAARRYDLLALLGEPTAHDRKAALEVGTRRLVEDKQRVHRAAQVWREVADLQVPFHPHLRKVLAAADAAAGGPAEEAADPRLTTAWLDRLAEDFARVRDEAAAAWRAAIRAEGGPDVAARLGLLDAGRYGAAARRHARATDTHHWRETAARRAAEQTYPRPWEAVYGLRAAQKLAEVWCEHPSDQQRHNWAVSLRTNFAKTVLTAGTYDLGEKDPKFFRVDTRHLREYLADQQPTFVPQLHDARWLVVVAPLERPTDPDFVEKAAAAVRQHGENAITVLLCPGLKAKVRDDLRRRLHDRGAFAAALDDLDLCRLLNPAGGVRPNGVLGLLEVVLEQQPWGARSPFSLAEGGDMRLEMYVGRREEAERLATSGDYTRVFSGRKLGKTALLHFVRRTWNNRELPNGRKLRVVYVGIAGVRNESTFIRKVLDELQVEFPGAIPPIPHHTPELFIAALRRFLREHPRENLLIVLDEADEFVQAQVDEYEGHRKEEVLSFQLRSEKYGDPNDTRVRYVYTGYRMTNTDGGAWVNAGHVLKLNPLPPDLAAELVGRPLARMGVDTAAAADDIAFRCGYQPAVLLKFGARLVKRLAEGGFREGAAVTAEDVIEVSEEEAVQEEIRRVVRANFQGNPLGQAVFAVLLDRLAGLPQGHGVRDPEDEVLAAFAEYWDKAARLLPERELGSRSLVAAQLRDMGERGLLTRLPNGGGYRLAFPHHLPTLLAGQNLAGELRANLDAWQQQDKTDAAAGRPGEFRGPLHRREMILLREYLGGEWGDDTPAAAVVGSLWAEGLDAPIGGLADRLGLDSVSAGDAPGCDGRWGDRRLWRGATPADLAAVLAGPRPADPPVVLTGGAGLIRAALKETRARPGQVEAVGPYRLTDGRVRWWFQRVRGVEFSSEQVYADAHRLTRGVPFLVGLYDRLVLPGGPQAGGQTTTAEEEDLIDVQFGAALNAGEFGLADGPPAARLTERELDLLRMVHVASVEFATDASPDFNELLVDLWGEDTVGPRWKAVYPDRPFPARYGERDDDPVSLEVLLVLGLLPARDGDGVAGRVAALAADDPVPRLLARLG